MNRTLKINSPAVALKKLWERIPGYIKLTFFSAMIFGFLIHLFIITNKLPNYDDVGRLFSDFKDITNLGRWFAFAPSVISSDYSLPLVNGGLSILYIAISACLIAKMLKIRSAGYCILLSAIMVAFPTVTCTFFFMCVADVFICSLMLACLAVYFTWKYRLGFIVGIILLTLSLGVYQAYLGIAAGLFLALLAFDLLDGDKSKKTLITGLKYLCVLVAGLAAYMLIVKITSNNVTLSDYKGISTMGQISLAELPSLVIGAYKAVLGYFYYDNFNVHYGFMKYVFLATMLLSAALLIWLVIRRKFYARKLEVVLFFVFLILFPLGFNIIYVVSVVDPPHTLMIYGLTLLPIFSISLLQRVDSEFSGQTITSLKKAWIPLACWVIVAAIGLYTFGYGIKANQAYLRMDVAYQQGYAYSSTLITRIESVDGYTSDDEVVFIGNFRTGATFDDPTPRFSELNKMFGIVRNIPTMYNYEAFLSKYMNHTSKITKVTPDKLSDVPFDQDILKSMPVYPDDGSIRRSADGVIVVKFVNEK